MITDAWVRVRERPTEKLSAGVAFDDFADGRRGGARDLAVRPQSLQLPAARRGRVRRPPRPGPPGKALLVLGFESAHHPVDGRDGRSRSTLRAAHGGEPGRGMRQRRARRSRRPASAGDDPVNAWRNAFLPAPYLRDSLVACGVLSDTFETAITWDRFPDFHAEVMETARRAVAAATGAPAEGTGSPADQLPLHPRLPGRPGARTTRCSPRRGAATRSPSGTRSRPRSRTPLIDAGGTITHHHAVGRDHRPWYDRQRPEPFADALRAAKRELDPKAVLNPGVLIDP